MTTGYSQVWQKRGLPANSVQDVAKAIVETSMDPSRKVHSMIADNEIITYLHRLGGCSIL